MGFNAMQPGKVKLPDILMFLFGLVLIAAAVIWVIR